VPRIRRGLLVLILLLTVCAVPFVPAAYAESLPPEDAAQEETVTSSADAAGLAEFERVVMVPMNVEIPSFYDEVANIAGMYIFTMPDGTVQKRIYGALDGEYGWYVPEGADNRIYVGAKPIDVRDDIDMYYKAYKDAGIDISGSGSYSGLLPPEKPVESLATVFGYPLEYVILGCISTAGLFCIIILLCATPYRRRKQR